MQKRISFRLLPREAANEQSVKTIIAQTEAIDPSSITGFVIIKQSIDARGRQVHINMTVKAFINEPVDPAKPDIINYKDVTNSRHRVLIVGAGPAGLFAALKLIENGIKPIILERGKDVRARRRDLAALNKEGEVNPESNYCFGEGGAGTYSDGKLYTRSTKRGDVNRILQIFTRFGAELNITYEAHPHIGTNKLPQIITAMRETIVGQGGEFHFSKKLTDLVLKGDRVTGAQTQDGDLFEGDAIILATGHSARDIFSMLAGLGLEIQSKPFALGVRVEHPQTLIDQSQYHSAQRDAFLPPASYSLVHQAANKGVFSFCMCPGGIIAPAATSPGELVVNGWSPSKRNNPYANSGIVVTVDQSDAMHYFKSQQKDADLEDPLLLMQFQQAVEQRAFEAGGGQLVAPAQRLVDFCDNRHSSSFPDCSYLPGIRSADLIDVLPSFVHQSLVEAFREFGKKIRGYYTNEAVLVATESRTSSPVRIPRHAELLHHPQVVNLYPCAEGAGYAGGIMSAAMDGERVVDMILAKIRV